MHMRTHFIRKICVKYYIVYRVLPGPIIKSLRLFFPIPKWEKVNRVLQNNMSNGIYRGILWTILNNKNYRWHFVTLDFILDRLTYSSWCRKRCYSGSDRQLSMFEITTRCWSNKILSRSFHVLIYCATSCLTWYSATPCIYLGNYVIYLIQTSSQNQLNFSRYTSGISTGI